MEHVFKERLKDVKDIQKMDYVIFAHIPFLENIKDFVFQLAVKKLLKMENVLNATKDLFQMHKVIVKFQTVLFQTKKLV